MQLQNVSNVEVIIKKCLQKRDGPLKGPSTRANLTVDLPAQTGLSRQERVCGHENCTPCKPIRAACAIFNM